jgi:AcrR family transcriptional regulator
MLGTPTRDRKAERREATRREILDAAWEIAGEVGLNQLTLRDVASRVGMQAPSLYSHFDSKMAIYDAMFGQAWSDYETTLSALAANIPHDPREALAALARHFTDFALAGEARYQLMNQRLIPGFVPSAESYAPAVRVLEQAHAAVLSLGEVSDTDFDLWIALIGGLINQHFANDPGGTRIHHLVDRATQMWSDSVGLPPTHL